MLNSAINATVLTLLLSIGAIAEPSISSLPALPATSRGQTIRIDGDNLPAHGVKVFLRRGTEKLGDKGIELDATVAGDGKSLGFKLPTEQFETGRYLVFVDFDSTELAVPGDLKVLPDQSLKVQIDSIFPATIYRSDQNKGYDFYISGTNLGQAANDNVLEVIGAGPQPVGTGDECKQYAASGNYEKTCLSYEPGMETRRLSVKGFHPRHYEGPVDFRLRVNGNPSETHRVTFSGITEAGLRLLATVVSAILGTIVLALVWRGIGIYKIEGESFRPAASFFLDKETNSYSLSKFQLFLWTAVAVFSFIFVFFCRILIQWNFSFPTVPSGWPTLLGLSAGATVAAVAITSNRGSKGAGPVKPSMADFISSGGLVVSDRFQFFVWTLVGCAGFLVLVLSQDPSTLKDIPNIPDGFLFLMGISATGYLGGKLVRLPGPVIRQLLVTSATPASAAAPGKMNIKIQGENLSLNALVMVNGAELRIDQFSITSVKSQDQAPDSSFCSEINLTLNDAGAYFEGEHSLTLTNKDGQMASSKFPVDPLTIDSVGPVTTSNLPKDASVAGKNFVPGIKAEWTNEDGLKTDIPTEQVQTKSPTELTVTLIPGPPGEGTLSLVSPIGLRTKAHVSIGA
jgi:hypothetical protein